MAYDLSITRPNGPPITREEVEALIADDAELAWATTDYVDMADDVGVSTRYPMITWRSQPCFWWYEGRIECAGPDEEQVAKLVEMSGALDACVIGDDGETYPQETSSTSPVPPAPMGWPLRKQLLAAFGLGCVLLVLKLLIFGE